MRRTRKTSVAGCVLGGLALAVAGSAVASYASGTDAATSKQAVEDATHPWDFAHPASVAKTPMVGPPAAVRTEPGLQDRQILRLDQRGGAPLPLPGADFVVDNMYQEALPTVYVTVLAGTTVAQPTRPVLRVVRMSPATGLTSSSDFPLPSGSGRAHLQTLTGETVAVTDAAGTASYAFDVSASAFR